MFILINPCLFFQTQKEDAEILENAYTPSRTSKPHLSPKTSLPHLIAESIPKSPLRPNLSHYRHKKTAVKRFDIYENSLRFIKTPWRLQQLPMLSQM